MSKVFFMNNGDFDIRAMLTMGLSAKVENSIGFFGTGFKYAVAIVLRHGGSVKISTLSGVYEFTARTEVVRDKEFQIVYLNDQPAGFTTHMGVNWENWMAYRELYCNAKDEGGRTDDVVDTSYDTIVEVDCPEILQAHHNRHLYFLETSPVFVHRDCTIHEGSRPFLYYKGIAVADMPNPNGYSYNIQRDLTLTEDRTVRFNWQVEDAIALALQACGDETILRTALRKSESYEANNLCYQRHSHTSEQFITVARTLLASDQGLADNARVLLKHLDEEMGNWPEFKLTPVQTAQLNKAKRFLASMDVDVDRFPVKTVYGLGDNVMGRALDGTIYLSEIPFDQGTKQVASTLLEEWVHNKYGCKDFDRAMQNWLFDKVLSLGENLQGEPI